jgi:YVTN family beta-propeller protein
VWVGSDDGTRGLLSRVDPADGAVDTVEVGRRPVRLTFIGTEDEGSVWTANQTDDSVSRVSVPLAGMPPTTYPVGDGPVRLQSPEGTPFVWVANGEGHTLSQIDASMDPVSGAVRTVRVGKDPRSISSSPGQIASADHADGTVSIVDATTAVRVATVPVGRSPSSILHVDPNLWVANAGDATVSVVDPRTESVIHQIDVGPQPAGLTPDNLGSVWVRNEGDASVSRLDIDGFRETAQVPVGGRPIAMAVTPGAVWVAVTTDVVARVDLDDEAVRAFELGCTPAAISSLPDATTVGPELRGVWIACEEGAILHISADA